MIIIRSSKYMAHGSNKIECKLLTIEIAWSGIEGVSREESSQRDGR